MVHSVEGHRCITHHNLHQCPSLECSKAHSTGGRVHAGGGNGSAIASTPFRSPSNRPGCHNRAFQCNLKGADHTDVTSLLSDWTRSPTCTTEGGRHGAVALFPRPQLILRPLLHNTPISAAPQLPPNPSVPHQLGEQLRQCPSGPISTAAHLFGRCSETLLPPTSSSPFRAINLTDPRTIAPATPATPTTSTTILLYYHNN